MLAVANFFPMAFIVELPYPLADPGHPPEAADVNGSLASEEAPEEGIYEHDNSVLCSVVCRLRALRPPGHVVAVPRRASRRWQPSTARRPARGPTPRVHRVRTDCTPVDSRADFTCHVLQINPTFAPDARCNRRLAVGVV